MRKGRKLSTRTASGQIELFAAVLVVATMIVVGAVLFLLDLSVSAYYKEKLQYITAQGASFAASRSDSERQAATQNFVNALCSSMSLKASNLAVSASKTVINGESAIVCAATGSFPLIPGFIFPAEVTMSGSSTAQAAGGKPTVISLSIFGIGNTFKAPNATAEGNIFGAENTVITAKSNSSSGNSDDPTGSSYGFGNNNTGTGNVYGNANNNSGSGTTFGSGNNTAGSGDTFGLGNTNNSNGNMQGANNTWN